MYRAALRRVNRQLSGWDDLDAVLQLPASQRYRVARPTVLSR